MSVTVAVIAASAQYLKSSPESDKNAVMRSCTVQLYRSATPLCWCIKGADRWRLMPFEATQASNSSPPCSFPSSVRMMPTLEPILFSHASNTRMRAVSACPSSLPGTTVLNRLYPSMTLIRYRYPSGVRTAMRPAASEWKMANTRVGALVDGT